MPFTYHTPHLLTLAQLKYHKSHQTQHIPQTHTNRCYHNHTIQLQQHNNNPHLHGNTSHKTHSSHSSTKSNPQPKHFKTSTKTILTQHPSTTSPTQSTNY
eukprot:Selendium_serpulae@DN9490_c0_g1_i1.p3